MAAKKSMKAAAAASSSVFDQIASGNVQSTQNTLYTQGTQDAENTQYMPESTNAQNTKAVPMERINLKIPAELKEYLTIAAAKASIQQRKNVSVTQYLCDLIASDMEQHKDD